MNSLSEIPFFRPVLFFAAGIGFGLYFSINLNDWAIGLFAGLLLGNAFLFLAKYKNALVAQLHNIFILFSFALCGVLISYASQSLSRRNHFVHHAAKQRLLKLRLLEEIASKANSWRCKASVIASEDSSGKYWQTSGNVLVYWPIKSNSEMPKLNYGDEIWVSNNVILMPSAAFPEDFDFKAVMRYKDVQHQLFLRENEWQVSGNSAKRVFQMAYQVRNGLLKKVHKVFSENTAAFIGSLLLGYRQEMSPDQLKLFSSTGTMHILAVSGLHVGVIYMLMVLLFTQRKRVMRMQRFQAIIILLGLWSFALITGFSPSVVRAVVMFTIIEAGNSFFFKKGNLINSLFAAAFLQLMWDPLNLIDAGFQLSYLAVLGIGLIYPRISLSIKPTTKLGLWLWELTALSISATAATLPATLYYFHSFPVWFVLGNIVAVPLVGIILPLAIASLAFAFIPFLGFVLAQSTSILISTMLYSIEIIGNLPFATIQAIFLTDVELLLISILIILVVFSCIKLTKPVVIAFLCCTLMLVSEVLFRKYEYRKMEQLIVCELRGEAIAAWHIGNTLEIISSPMPHGRTDSLFLFMRNYCLKYNVNHVKWSKVKLPVLDLAKITNSNKLFGQALVLNSAIPNNNEWKKVYCRKRDVRFWVHEKGEIKALQNTFELINLH